ncbi:MAG TPA: hypothetical protein VI434_09545 [Candidatus Dormibacteraeota bacterium]
MSVAWAASFGFVVLSALPTLEGDVLYVEVIGALLVVCAVLLVAAGAVGVIAVAAIALGIGGSLPGRIDVLTHQDETDLQSASVGGGSGVAAGGGSGLVLLLMTVTRILLVLAVGSIITWRLARRQQIGASVAAWWLTWGLTVVVVSALGLAHYVQQMAPALCLCAALLASRLVRRLPMRQLALAVATAVIAWVVAVGALIGTTAEASMVVHQKLATFVTSIVSPHVITRYLGGGWERVLGLTTTAKYEAGFGSQPSLVRAVVAVIDAHTQHGDHVFVWGRVPRAYSLSTRFPAGRYTSLNSSFTLDSKALLVLMGELDPHPPAVLVQLQPLPAGVRAPLTRLHYAGVSMHADGDVVWIAPWRM